MKHLFLILFSLLVYGCDKEGSEEVYIPDAKFKEQLLFNKDINILRNLPNFKKNEKLKLLCIAGLYFYVIFSENTVLP